MGRVEEEPEKKTSIEFLKNINQDKNPMCLFHGKQKRIVFMKQNCVEAISSDQC